MQNCDGKAGKGTCKSLTQTKLFFLYLLSNNTSVEKATVGLDFRSLKIDNMSLKTKYKINLKHHYIIHVGSAQNPT